MATYQLTLTDEDGAVLDHWKVDATGADPDAWDLSKEPARQDLLEEILETMGRPR